MPFVFLEDHQLVRWIPPKPFFLNPKAPKVEPRHDVFTRFGDSLEMCVPCLLHGDEGVGHRRKPVMQMLWGPLLRVGLGAIHRLFFITCCPHKYYSKYNQGTAAGNPVLDRLMVECGRSAARAYYTGIETSHGRFHLVFLGLAGDHPFQVKVSHSLRSHLRVDICPWCEANIREDVPFEDFSLGATWRQTVFQSVPWAPGTQPPMVLIPGGDHPGFLKWDLMHMIPHGCARNFCASITCMLCGPMQMFAAPPGPDKKKERCLDAAYEHFGAWLACTGQSVRDLKEFSPENLQWINNRGFPDSNCKAADTTLWVKWLLDFLGTMPWEWQEPLDHAYEGLLALDQFLRLCYDGNDRLFFGPEQQQAGSEKLLRFLRAYESLAFYWFQRGWCLFGFTPKCHFSAHWHEELFNAVRLKKKWAWNPGAFSTPMMEDFVGLCSRMSRSVHAGTVPISTIRKYLVEVLRHWADAE